MKIEFAYDSTGSPFRNYDPHDFTLDENLKVNNTGCTFMDTGDNYIVIDPDSRDYEITVTGFDQSRDVIVSVTNYTEQGADE